MIVNELDTSRCFRLMNILNLLESQYGITLDFASATKTDLMQVLEELDSFGYSLNESSSLTSKFKETAKAETFLIKEAIDLFLAEVTPV